MENGTDGSLRVILPFPPCPILLLLTPIFHCYARTQTHVGGCIRLKKTRELDTSWIKPTQHLKLKAVVDFYFAADNEKTKKTRS